MDGTAVAGEPRMHLVGYGPSASTIGANRAGQAAARQLRRLLRPADGAPPLRRPEGGVRDCSGSVQGLPRCAGAPAPARVVGMTSSPNSGPRAIA